MNAEHGEENVLYFRPQNYISSHSLRSPALTYQAPFYF